MRPADRERWVRVLSGLVAVVLTAATVVFGVKAATGALASTYEVDASFTTAGQGLSSGSDVKVRGVNIGKVASVHLVNGEALVRMAISSDQRIPVASRAVIRPKTLFGEKYVDVDPGTVEGKGPFLTNHGRITNTLGGYELEDVLGAAYPLLKAVNPADLTTVLDTLAGAGQGEGPAINRQITNFLALSNVQVAHDADTEQFLSDLGLISEEVDARAGDIVGLARNLNSTLPDLNARSGDLTTVLDQAARLSSDLADVLEANQPFLVKGITEGGQLFQTLYDRRGEIVPLLNGIRQYFEIQAEIVRIPAPDGTMLGAVELGLGEDCPTGRVSSCPSALGPNGSGSRVPGGAPGGAPGGVPGGAAVPSLGPLPRLPVLTLPTMQPAEQSLVQLLQGL